MQATRIAISLAAVCLALAGLAIAASLAASHRAAETARAAQETSLTLEEIESDLRALRSAGDGTRTAAGAPPLLDAPPSADLVRRVAALEAALAERRDAEVDGERVVPNGAASAAEFEKLEAKVLAAQATPAEEAEFWKRLRTSDALPTLIQKLEARVVESPTSAEARLLLARAYVARLYTVPDGPERGAWAAHAEGQWRQVLARDDRNWEARYGLATSLGEWPAAFGKGPEAIRHLETLREQQEGLAPQPEHAQVYLQLAALYRREGKVEKALEILRVGAQRFPTSDELREALEGAE